MIDEATHFYHVRGWRQGKNGSARNNPGWLNAWVEADTSIEAIQVFAKAKGLVAETWQKGARPYIVFRTARTYEEAR